MIALTTRSSTLPSMVSCIIRFVVASNFGGGVERDLLISSALDKTISGKPKVL